MKQWLNKAWHYIKLIFKKSSLDNVILEYFINEIIHSAILIELEKKTHLNRETIILLLDELLTVYNQHL